MVINNINNILNTTNNILSLLQINANNINPKYIKCFIKLKKIL